MEIEVSRIMSFRQYTARLQYSISKEFLVDLKIKREVK